MATDGPSPVTIPQEAIDQRLDAVDRLLLGLLPRSERLEFVTRLESTIRQRLAENPAAEIGLAEPIAEANTVVTRARSARPKRSAAAFTAGLSGIASLVLLFIVLPLAYIAVAVLSSTLDFDATILSILLGLVPLAACVAGCAAVVLGIVGLVKIARREGALVGRGWAVTGLCTGLLPVLCGAVPLLFICIQMLAASAVSVGVSPVAYSPSSCTSCGPTSPYSPATVPAPVYPVSPYATGPVYPPPGMPSLQPADVKASPYPDGVSTHVVPVANALPPELPASPPLPESPSTLPPDTAPAPKSPPAVETPPTSPALPEIPLEATDTKPTPENKPKAESNGDAATEPVVSVSAE